MGNRLARSTVVRVLASLALAGPIGPAIAAEVEIGAVFQPEFNGALGRLVTGDQHDLTFGETVYLDETVETGPDSSTAVLFRDQTRLQVGANSRVVLDRFVYDPDAGGGEAIIDFGQGIFRFISGDMPKDKVKLRTPTAVMAIRGTTLIIYVAPDNTTQVAVISGEIGVSPCGGGDSVTAGEGFSASVSGDCTTTDVVPGVITPPDPAVIADLDFSALSPAAGPTPSDDNGANGPPAGGGQVASGGPAGGPAGGAGGGSSGGGDPGGGDPGGGNTGGGDPGGGDPGGGDPGPGNGNGNGGNPGNGGGNTGGSGPGTGNGGPGTGDGGTPKGG